MSATERVYVAGHGGLVGSAIVRRLRERGYPEPLVRSRSELDLAEGDGLGQFLQLERPGVVILAAAKVGGIVANSRYPADFIEQNLAIELNVLRAARRSGVRNLIFLGSSCIYPRDAPQPLREEYLLSGSLEPTNEPYAVAKIAGVKLCQAYNAQYGIRYVSLMPTNLYGPGDNFDLETSHVLPALIKKFHRAKIEGLRTVPVWGSGRPRREFLHVDDLADAAAFVVENLIENRDFPDLLNVGTGQDVSIARVVELVRDVVGTDAEPVFDPAMPDGTPRKLMDVSRMATLGWRSSIGLEDGLRDTYEWYARTAHA